MRVAELRGHTSRVLHMAQSPDGTTIATAAADETLRFWKILSGHEKHQTDVRTSGSKLHMSPRDSMLASAAIR